MAKRRSIAFALPFLVLFVVTQKEQYKTYKVFVRTAPKPAINHSKSHSGKPG